MDTIALNLKGKSEDLPVIYRTGGGTYAVLDNRTVKHHGQYVFPAAENPYYVVHAATGLLLPVPPNVGVHTQRSAKAFADFMDESDFFDGETGKPLVKYAVVRDAMSEWETER